MKDNRGRGKERELMELVKDTPFNFYLYFTNAEDNTRLTDTEGEGRLKHTTSEPGVTPT